MTAFMAASMALAAAFCAKGWPLMNVWSARPTTALAVTHNLSEALVLPDRIIVLSPRPAHVLGVFEIRQPRGERDQHGINSLKIMFLKEFPRAMI